MTALRTVILDEDGQHQQPYQQAIDGHDDEHVRHAVV